MQFLLHIGTLVSSQWCIKGQINVEAFYDTEKGMDLFWSGPIASLGFLKYIVVTQLIVTEVCNLI